MRHPAVSFLPGQPPPADNILETNSFNNTSSTLSSYLASSAAAAAAAASLKLGQSPQQRPSPSTLPQLQFLFQPQVTTPTTTTTNTVAENDLSTLSITPTCEQSDGNKNTIHATNPTIAVPVPINPMSVTGITQNLAAQNVLSCTLQQQREQKNQQQHQQEQQTDFSQLAVSQTLANNHIPAFLENDQMFQTLLSNMRHLEWKIPIESAQPTLVPESGNKAETSHMSSIFVDVCSV